MDNPALPVRFHGKAKRRKNRTNSSKKENTNESKETATRSGIHLRAKHHVRRVTSVGIAKSFPGDKLVARAVANLAFAIGLTAASSYRERSPDASLPNREFHRRSEGVEKEGRATHVASQPCACSAVSCTLLHSARAKRNEQCSAAVGGEREGERERERERAAREGECKTGSKRDERSQ